jgi:hypothetical protein
MVIDDLQRVFVSTDVIFQPEDGKVTRGSGLRDGLVSFNMGRSKLGAHVAHRTRTPYIIVGLWTKPCGAEARGGAPNSS